ncbi:putative tumor necrosis factor alpha-induced protein 2-like [Scophthalmus maximus]|uniref:Putative tumor necrosis factor alpha-induced protein 2-like n=1 Tax=Scophthalmus maximus TaxID=52904 RepID=A0A2U9B6E4_SCOMX|nr:putative tumor necrosis factor alpha-induced protein 2-like [Scophthalmus maximus]
MSLNITPQHHHHNPFDNNDDDADHGDHWSPGSSLLDGDVPRDRNPFEDEEDENEANEGKKGSGGGGGGSAKSSFKFKSPLKSLGKLGKSLRASGRSKGSATPSPQGSLQGTPSPAEKKKRGRRSSEGSLLRFAGKYRDTLSSYKESFTNGEPNCSESECDSTSRRLSFMKMVGLGKLKRESMADHSSQGPEEQPVPEEEVVEEVKPREPLSGQKNERLGFVQRCAQCDPSVSEDSLRRANKALDHIVQQGVRVLSERLYLQIRPFFERLVKRKWLSNTEPLEQVESLVKDHFKKFHRMDSPPYQLLVAEVHRRVVMEYLRSVMRGRIICTSMKMRKRMAGRLRDEGKQIKVLFKDLESPASWLDSALSHISEIIQLEDVPSIQMEVGVLVREFPDVRKKHVSAILNIRGMTRQAERQEILNIVKDIESCDGGSSSARLSRDHALFSEVPVTSEVHCLNLGLSRIALTASSCFTALRPRRRKTRTPVQENPDDVL